MARIDYIAVVITILLRSAILCVCSFYLAMSGSAQTRELANDSGLDTLFAAYDVVFADDTVGDIECNAASWRYIGEFASRMEALASTQGSVTKLTYNAFEGEPGLNYRKIVSKGTYFSTRALGDGASTRITNVACALGVLTVISGLTLDAFADYERVEVFDLLGRKEYTFKTESSNGGLLRMQLQPGGHVVVATKPDGTSCSQVMIAQ